MSYSQTYTIDWLAGPGSSCFGGQICANSPTIGLYQIVNGEKMLATSTTGYRVFVNMGPNPPNLDEPLYEVSNPSSGGCTVLGDCGDRVIADSASYNFVNGIAVIENILIKNAGAGYTLAFEARDPSDAFVAYDLSEPFEVFIGPAYKLFFDTFTGTATGGVPFAPNPVVGIGDRGGNLISSVNEGTITVSVSAAPLPTIKLQPDNQRKATIINGKATFQGLFINEAGKGYKLLFTASLSMAGSNQIESNIFGVTVGPPARITFDNRIGDGNLYAGDYFESPPRLTLRDAGSNHIKTDFINGLQIEIHSNPSGAVLQPTANTFAVAKRGIVTFSSIKLDKQGPDFVLKFKLMLADTASNSYVDSGVFILSEKFNVLHGPLRSISTLVSGDNAIAGGQSMGIQPKLELKDYGDNVLSLDYSTPITAQMISSPAVETAISVTTSAASNTSALDTITTQESGTFGVGEELEFAITFDYPIRWETGSPSLQLNIKNSSDLFVYATFQGPYSETLAVNFQYILQTGDYVVNDAIVDANGVDALNLNGSSFKDGNHKNVIWTLPSPSGIANSNIYVNTSAPAIININTTSADGNYGSADVINFYVKFNAPVVVSYDTSVSGLEPYLKVTVGTDILDVYYTHSTENNTVLVFPYTVVPVHNGSIGLDHSEVFAPNATIKRYSATPTTDANLLAHDHAPNFINNHALVVDTSAPQLDTTYGVKADVADGYYFPGDKIILSIKYDTKIVLVGAANTMSLALDITLSGVAITAPFKQLLADEQTMEFTYSIGSGHNSSALNIALGGEALDPGSTTIRRKTTGGGTVVDRNTTLISINSNSLANARSIMIYGESNIEGNGGGIDSIEISSTTPSNPTDNKLYPDDIVRIKVTFITATIATCSPVLVMYTGEVTGTRYAVYESGSGTKEFIFRYTIEAGDKTNHIYLQNGDALKVKHPDDTTLGCTFYVNSSYPIQNVDTSITLQNFVSGMGEPIGGTAYQVMDRLWPFANRNTTVKSITVGYPSGTELAAGYPVTFTLEWTDEVFCISCNDMRLWINTGRFAKYYSSPSTNYKWVFKWEGAINGGSEFIQQGEDIADLQATSYETSGTALRCNDGTNYIDCILENRNGNVNSSVDTNTSLAAAPSGVSIYTQPPVISSIFSTKPTSPYDGVYSVGETIDIIVRFDRPIIQSGATPNLEMDLSNGQRRAAFQMADNAYDLRFRLTIIEGDSSANLTTTGTASLITTNVLISRSNPAQKNFITAITTAPTATPIAINSNTIKIDGINRALVTQVTSITPNGRYAPGDQLELKLSFDKYVVLTGIPELRLKLGDHYSVAYFSGISNTTTNAANDVNIPTKELLFKYTIVANDFSDNLDYVDSFSFTPGTVPSTGGEGQIYLAATNPTFTANLDLPNVGYNASLSVTANLVIDGYAPFFEKIFFKSLAGTYQLGETITVCTNFSQPVTVTGAPRLRIGLDNSTIKAYANYAQGSGSKMICYDYIPGPGHESSLLDYYGDRTKISSASATFELNGGSLLSTSTTPSLPASIVLNAPSGILKGAVTQQPIAGIIAYRDLAIAQRGLDYTLFFTCQATPNLLVRVSQVIFVSFSMEFELRPATTALKGDLIGWAVDVDDDIAVVGAPSSNYSITEIQTITTSASLTPAVSEIQIVRAESIRQQEIQSFFTSADPDTQLGGSFNLKWGLHGPTRDIPYNADADMLKVIIHEDLPVLGAVSVTRVEYTFPAAYDAYNWTVTFLQRDYGKTDNLLLDGSKLTGGGVGIFGPSVIQESPTLGGYFQLTVPSFNEVSSALPYDATPLQIAEACAEMGLLTEQVNTFSDDVAGGRTWEIEFKPYAGSYDVPELGSISDGLTGNAHIWHSVPRNGVNSPTGLSGGFRIEFRHNTTAFLPYDSADSFVKQELEALPTIGEVTVTRSAPTSVKGFTWTITFDRYYRATSRGYIDEGLVPLDPIIGHSELIGTNTTVKVGAIRDPKHPKNYGQPERLGSVGKNAGAAYIFQKSGEGWNEVSRLVGKDTTEEDRFGSSVSIDGDVMIIGAITADVQGILEKQSIFCSAHSGTFKLYFRGWETEPIDASITITDLKFAIEADKTTMKNLHPISKIDIEDWGGGPLCNNNTAQITFYSPVDGHKPLFNGIDTGPNLELLQVRSNELKFEAGSNTTGVVKVLPIQDGTRRTHGPDTDPKQQGAAYIFRAKHSCAANASVCVKDNWQEEIQVFPLNSVGGERFGSSVAVSGSFAAVGSPGANFEKGSVTVFYETNGVGNGWTRMQDSDVVGLESGDNFGHVVRLKGSTLAIGAPGTDNGKGYVYMFKRNLVNQYVYAQKVRPPTNTYPLAAGDRFGHSIGLHGNTLVVGAYGTDTDAIYFGNKVGAGDLPAEGNKDTGRVYVFQRPSEASEFIFFQILTPTNVRQYDRFGWDVYLDKNKLLVGSKANHFIENLPASKAIVAVRTEADYNGEPVGTGFKLRWLTSEDGSMRETREISYTTTAADMKAILEADLSTGDIIVSRSNQDAYNRGYEWRISFMEIDDTVNLPIADANTLTGTNARVVVEYVNPYPTEVRGKSHLFQRVSDSSDAKFVEEVFVIPFTPQPIDLCGHSVALSGNIAMIGCPNRDYAIPNLNSGAAVVFTTDMLQLQFTQPTFTVTEGSTATINLSRRTFMNDVIEKDILVYVETIDGNAGEAFQKYLSSLYGVRSSDITYPRTAVDHIQLSGTAVARSQDYGSSTRAHTFVDGMYDYRAISDYVPIKNPLSFLIELNDLSTTIDTSADTIVENPNEAVTIAIHAPGLWPSTLSTLVTTLTIQDNADGYVSSLNGGDTAFSKVYQDTPERLGGMGTSIAVSEDLEIMLVGSPTSTVNSFSKAGSVTMFAKDSNNKWQSYKQFVSPTPGTTRNFGLGVAIHKVADRPLAFMCIGEPNGYSAYVYVSEGESGVIGKEWVLESTLQRSDATSPQHRFAAEGAIAIFGDNVVIGSSGLELVSLYIRTYHSMSNITWEGPQTLKSSDYDYDVILGLINLHSQDFGVSVSAQGRSILVGAPYANYDKLGSNLVEVDINTEGTSIKSFGRGKAYVFFQSPQIQHITLTGTNQLPGTFQLRLMNRGIDNSTIALSAATTATELKAALEDLLNIEQVSVSASDGFEDISSVDISRVYRYHWIVTFEAEFHHLPELTPRWWGGSCSGNDPDTCYNCTICSDFDDPTLPTTIPRFSITTTKTRGEWSEIADLIPSDRRNGDRFGASVAIDGDQIVVGSPYNAAVSATTWDFETGSLEGWSTRGTAFDLQPTFGDNPYLRPNTVGEDGTLTVRPVGIHSNLEGRYFVGTAEARPGNKLDYRTPDPNYNQGSYVGDAPMGEMSSQVFSIYGSVISFLVGGGCDSYKEYVELLVDGLSVARATGECDDSMKRQFFDTSPYVGRAGQIRVVDASPSSWGHINVDDFRFDWVVTGAIVNGTESRTSKSHFGGMVETPRSGAAYTFRRHAAGSDNLCVADPETCIWSEESKLMASDKREDSLFGVSVAVNDEAGVVLVGAPGTRATGFYKETPRPYPYIQGDGNYSSAAAQLQFPFSERNALRLQALPEYAPTESGANAVWQLLNETGLLPLDERSSIMTGAVYVYAKDHAVAAGNIVTQIQKWSYVEHAKMQSPDQASGDSFGQSVAIDKQTLAVGAPGNSGTGLSNTGAAYVANAGFASISFQSAEVQVLEGTDSVARVFVVRNVDVYSGPLTFEFATSDLTAQGVDSAHYTYCTSVLPTLERGSNNCGDYEQTRGTVVMTGTSTSFAINIVDDLCKERNMEWFQVTLSIPGGNALQGEFMSMKVRIDDNDFLLNECT